MRILYLFMLLVPFSFVAQDLSENAKTTKDPSRNIGYFNITKISYSKISFVEQDLFIEGVGNLTTKLDDSKAASYAINTINGYFFSPYFSVGLGLGMEGINNPNINTLPIYVDVRTYFTDEPNTPYLFLNLGTLVKVNDEFNRGGLLAIGGGYKFFATKKLALVTDLSFSTRGISLTDESIQKSDNTIKTRGFAISLGVIF